MSVNKVILVGNLGRDAEVKTTAGGLSIASLNIATTDRKKDASGQWTDHTEWHRVTCFDKLASVMERFGKKGKQVYIEGRIQTREYTDKDGNKRWSTEVVASDVRLLGGARDDAGQSSDRSDRPAPPRTERAPAKPAKPAPADDFGGYGDDDGLPF